MYKGNYSLAFERVSIQKRVRVIVKQSYLITECIVSCISQLILTTTLRCEYYYSFHFTDEEIGA